MGSWEVWQPLLPPAAHRRRASECNDHRPGFAPQATVNVNLGDLCAAVPPPAPPPTPPALPAPPAAPPSPPAASPPREGQHAALGAFALGGLALALALALVLALALGAALTLALGLRCARRHFHRHFHRHRDSECNDHRTGAAAVAVAGGSLSCSSRCGAKLAAELDATPADTARGTVASGSEARPATAEAGVRGLLPWPGRTFLPYRNRDAARYSAIQPYSHDNDSIPS